ncbi:hypothetical protein TNCV_85971 [Trichonephila clavipes]|nr:hypothetical protein TNCV_85971 [Trichonephila clavipes]
MGLRICGGSKFRWQVVVVWTGEIPGGQSCHLNEVRNYEALPCPQRCGDLRYATDEDDTRAAPSFPNYLTTPTGGLGTTTDITRVYPFFQF